MDQNKNIKHVDGETIFLRHLKKTDATLEYIKWLNSKKINQFLESRFTKHTQKDVENYIKQMNSNNDLLFFAIIRKDNQKHIGNIKLGPINKNHNLAEIGIMIGDEKSWGKGYASEAIKIISDLGFNLLKLHKITAGSYEENIGSIKAFLKAGFFIEGVRSRHFFSKGKYQNHILLAKMKKLY
jgi:ribosomal-protein-alanine N-acetyltransferase